MSVAIDYMILKYLDDILLNTLQSEISQSDPTRAGLVRVGPLQDDPTRLRVNILTYNKEREDPEGWQHIDIQEGSPTHTKVDPSTSEIGGGELWYRRFTVELEIFFPPSIPDREESLRLATIILARAERTIQVSSAALGPDDFGQICLLARVMKSNLTAAGGPGTEIYHVKLWVQALTEKER